MMIEIIGKFKIEVNENVKDGISFKNAIEKGDVKVGKLELSVIDENGKFLSDDGLKQQAKEDFKYLVEEA